MSSHDEWADQVAAYLLHALPDDERESFEAHLETCSECRDEVRFLSVASDALPNSPVQLSPPPELKDRIMAVVHAEAELLRAAGPEADRPVVAARERRRWSFSLRPALALAATVLAVAVGVVAFSSSEEGGGGGPRETRFVAENAELIKRESGHSTLVAHGLEQPAPGHVYQVWLKREKQPDPAPTNALFSASSDGSASVDVPGDLEGVEAVLVTQEPDGGSPAPTSDPIIAVETS